MGLFGTQGYSFENIKLQAEEYMNETYGKIFSDKFTVVSAGTEGFVGNTNYIYMKSERFSNCDIVAKFENNKIVSCNYIELHSYEEVLRPYLNLILKKIDENIGLVFSYSGKYAEGDYKWTADDYLKKEGASFDIYLTEFSENEKTYDDLVKEMTEDAVKEHGWWYRYIRLIFCEKLPDKMFYTSEQFDQIWNDKCHKKKWRSYVIKRNGEIEKVTAKEYY